jgi:hypothetical protein
LITRRWIRQRWPEKLVAEVAAIKPDILEKVRAAYATGN